MADKVQYPRWRYNAKGAVLVNSEEEDKKLGGTWYDNPAQVPAEKPAPVSDKK